MRNLLIIAAAFVVLSSGRSGVSVGDLTCEGLSGHVAIQYDRTPRFGWKLSSTGKNVVQKAYRIQVASSEKFLSRGRADVWDSGWVKSGQSVGVRYEGPKVAPRQKVCWKVSIETSAGRAESDVASFETGLSDDSWKGLWIGAGCEEDYLGGDDLDSPGPLRSKGKTVVPARYLRKEFSVGRNVSQARLYICGLGLYEAYINGKNVAPGQVLSPTMSEYDRTAYYNVIDVTDLLRRGDNAVGVILGSGRFTSMRIPKHRHYGLPRLLCQVEVRYADGSMDVISSDGTWMATSRGPIRSDNEFDGEKYDASLEMPGWTEAGFTCDSRWAPAEIEDAPKGGLEVQMNPNMAIMQTLEPVSISKRDTSFVIDMGQNMVGWIDVENLPIEKGKTLRMHFCETLRPDGSPDYGNLRSADALDEYRASSSGNMSWHPLFVYHGFRYVEVSGVENVKAENFKGRVIYDRMPSTGSFSCSDEVLERIYRNAFWGIRGNYRGMPTDCPQRDERVGWLGDRTTGCYGEAYLFGNYHLYSKWTRDIRESQMESGSIPDVAPYYWEICSDNMTWPAAFVRSCDMIYRMYGDPSPIRDNYQAMKKWLLYMKERYGRDGLITKDTYGDWCVPPERPDMGRTKDPSRITDGTLISTAFYYDICRMMGRFAPIAGESSDVEYFEKEASLARDAFNKKFLYKEKCCYGNNTVTSNLLPLWFGMVPEDVKDMVLESIVEKTGKDFGGHVSCGVVGIQQLLRCLTDNGRGDLALEIASSTTYPSWGYMAENGATTIWELWNGNSSSASMNSGNHVMLLGDLLIWMYEYLGGISPLEPGFRKILLRPFFDIGLQWVDCSYDSVYGRIESRWRKGPGGRMQWDFTIPPNTTATVVLRDGTTAEYGSGSWHLEM